MAHLMRRAGFGASHEELEARLPNGYEATVEELLDPASQEPVDLYDLFRYQPWTWKPGTIQGMGHASWLDRMLNIRAPLERRWPCSGTASSPRESPRRTTGMRSSTW